MKFLKLLIFPLIGWLLFVQLGGAWLHHHTENTEHKHFTATSYMAGAEFVKPDPAHKQCFGCLLAKLESTLFFKVTAILNIALFVSEIIFAALKFHRRQFSLILCCGRAPPVFA